MSVQNITLQQTRSFLQGDITDLNPRELITYINETELIIPFGRAVVQGATDGDARLPLFDSDTFVGVTVNVKDRPTSDIGGDSVGYLPGEAMSVQRQGRISVRPENTVTPGEFVSFFSFGGLSLAGKWANIAGNGLITLDNASWERDAIADTITVIRVVPKPTSFTP